MICETDMPNAPKYKLMVWTSDFDDNEKCVVTYSDGKAVGFASNDGDPVEFIKYTNGKTITVSSMDELRSQTFLRPLIHDILAGLMKDGGARLDDDLLAKIRSVTVPISTAIVTTNGWSHFNFGKGRIGVDSTLPGYDDLTMDVGTVRWLFQIEIEVNRAGYGMDVAIIRVE